MRHIHTPDALVEQLKKEAKKLQRKSGGKYVEALDKVAKKAKYDHWHHVTLCAKHGERNKGIEEIEPVFNGAIAAARRREANVKLTSGNHGIGPYLVFSTSSGDAWVLDPDGFGAICLLWNGEPTANDADQRRQKETGWPAQYELLGDFFRVESDIPQVGTQVLAGYPTGKIRAAIDKAMSMESRFAMTLGQADAVEMTSDVMSRMAKRGWSIDELENMKAEGYVYSPGRDTLLSPTMSSEDGDFDDSEMNED